MANPRTSKWVAIIDDDAHMREALLDSLDEAGFSAQAFPSAEEFLDSGRRHHCSCIIADIRMPGMSGLDLQAKLNAERLRVSFIFITAHSDEQMRMQALRAGAVEFLGKPFDDEVLLDTCERRWSADRRGKSSDPLVGLLAGTIGGALAM